MRKAANPARSTLQATNRHGERGAIVTTGTSINSHRIPGFGKFAGRILLAAMALVAALCFMLQSPVHVQAQADQAGTVSLSPTETEMGIPLTATLADADGGVTGTTWQWSSADTASGTFADISGATSATYRPAEADLEKYLKATASYTDSLDAGKSASATTASAVTVVDRVLVDNISNLQMLLGSTVASSGMPGLASRFMTGNHPAGYKLSDVTIAVSGNLSLDDVRMHIYSAQSNGYPDSSVFQIGSPSSGSGDVTFTAPEGARLQPNTVYHVALVTSGSAVACVLAMANEESPGSASDWSVGASQGLDASGNATGVPSINGNGCAMTIRGQAAIDTSYVEDVEITSTPADSNGYVVGETLEATVTMSAAVTVDTGTPPTLSVVVGSTTRTMTYNATDSTSTKLQFDYTVVADEEDTDGVSFEESALTGTITRTSDSKAADLEHAAVPDDADAKVVDLTAVTVEFEDSTYTVAESDDSETTDMTENAVEVKVTLSADPGRTVIIPITKTNEGGASNSDYSGVPASVTFDSGETEQTFTFTATADTVDDDLEKVTLSFGTLPTGVTAGTTSETTVSITDDDYPNITVSFRLAAYTVNEGFSVQVDIDLSGDPERNLLIPLTRTFLGGAIEADLDAPSTAVHVVDGSVEGAISFRTEQDTVADHGESVRLGFGTLPAGVTASGTTTTTVTIIDDDPAVEVEFGETASSVAEGETATVTVTLSAAPMRPLKIPITLAYLGGATLADHTISRGDVAFGANSTSESFSFDITDDAIADDGESILVGFGAFLPPGVSAGTDTTATVTIIDNDPAVTVKFDSTTYSVAEGDDVEVTVTLSADPMRPLTIPISAESDGSTTAADSDYDIPDSVTFNSGDTSATFTFTTTENTTADHGKELDLSFGSDLPPGVTASGTTTATVTIIDDDPAVTVNFPAATLEVIEGESAAVFLTLTLRPQRPFTISVIVTNQGGAGSGDHNAPATYSIEFDANDPAKRINISITQDTLVERGEGIKLAIGSDLPPGVSTGANDEMTITFIDDDPAVTASFGAATYSADEGDSVDVTVTLSADPQRSVTIPITGAGESGGTSADFSVPTSVTFASGDTSKTISFTATDDTIDDDDEKVRLAFGSDLPPGVTASGTTTTTISINDDDDPELTVMFGNAAYTATEGGTTTVTVTLNADPERTVVVPISVTRESGASTSDYSGIPSTVTFVAGDTSESFTFTAVDDDIDDDGEKVKLSFGTLPARVTAGAVGETIVSITDNDTRGVTITPTALSIVELAWDDYTVVLDSEPTGEVTITITDPTDSDEVEVPTASLTFTTDNWDTAQSVRVNVGGDYVDEPDETATVTHSASGGDYGSVTVDSVVVTVEDDDATPVITGSATKNFAEIEYDADADAFDKTVATYSATDGDTNPETTTWAVSGTDADKFTITMASGVLSFDEPPDFENPTDSGSGNTYEVTVEASDGTNTGTFAVTVTVTPVDETPLVMRTIGPLGQLFIHEPAYHRTISGTDLVSTYFLAEDQEMQSLTWSLGGTDAGHFKIEDHPDLANFSQLLFRNQWDYENPTDADMDNRYHIIVKASDGTNTGELPYVINVVDINERPDIDEDTVADYTEIEFDFTGTPGNVHTFTATDYDEDDTFTWSLEGDDAAAFDIDSDTGVLTFRQVLGSDPLPDFESPADDDSGNTYEIIVKATDDDSTPLSSSYAVTVKVTNVNEKPEFTGTPETAISYDEKKTENVADYNARDEEGPVTWSLTGTDRGDFAISTDGIVTFAATPNYEDAKDSNTDNVYTFNVVATDTQSGSTRRNATTSVTVTVVDLEEAGVITVSNLNPGVGDEITFELSDPDGGLKDISWNLESRASSTASWSAVSGWFTSVSQATLATYSVTEDVTGHELRMQVDYADRRTTATDDPGTVAVNEGQDKTATSDDTEPVTADPIVNAPPRFRGGGDFSIAEGEAGRNVGTPLVVSDRDNDTLRFGIEAGAGDDFFAINATSGQLSLIEAVDFEDPPTLGFYLITVTLHDGKDADGNAEADPVVDITTGVSVTVTDVEEEGVVTLSAEEPESGTPLDATLEDGDGSVSGAQWQWARSENGRTNWINIAGETLSSYTPTEDDEDFYLRARVEYTDNRGSGKSAEGITTGPVPSENRRPTFPDAETGDRTVDENTRAGTNIGAPVAAVDPERNRLTYSLTGTDADAFTIVATTGQLRTKDALDFETKDSYSVTVNVHDGRDGAGATSTDIDNTQDVTITVENVEEPGTVALSSVTQTIQARVEVTAVLSDDDVATDVTWQWTRSTNGRTNWFNIPEATNATFTPTLAEDAGNYIRATASYTDGHGANKTANKVSPRVGEPPPVNSAPAFPSTEDGRRDVPENSAGGTTIGAPVAATDLNAGDATVNDPLAYSLTGTDAASFTIDAGTGQLQVGQDLELDFEGTRSYRVTVQVTDGRDRNGDDDNDVIDDTINVTINVTNVNEAPTVSGEMAATFAENDSSAIATYTGTDPERDPLTWSVSGTDGASFAMTDRGRLHFASPPSFEGGKTTYEVTVVATDEDGLTGMIEVTVTVTDVEEEGIVALAPPRGWPETPFTATLTDDDGGVADQTWQWARSTNRSRWTDITGQTSDMYTATADDIDNYLRVSTEYTDRTGSGQTAEAVLAVRIAAVADKPQTNTMPEFADDAATRSVGQGTASGRAVGGAVRATDADRDDVLVYSLSGTDADSFDIDPATGQLRTKAVLAYDPEGPNTYMVTVNVHDGFDQQYAPLTTADDSIDVTITVTAVRRTTTTTTGGGGFGAAAIAPKFTDGFRTSRPLALNAQPGDAVGDPVGATHPEDSPITYSLSGADAALFTVDAETGQIHLGEGVSLELGHTYTVNLTATDSSGTGAIIIVDIEVVEGLFDPYDLNRNGIIEKDEVMKAVSDYFAGLIEKAEVLEIVSRYFAE